VESLEQVRLARPDTTLDNRDSRRELDIDSLVVAKVPDAQAGNNQLLAKRSIC
jgi:hypothetical protein